MSINNQKKENIEFKLNLNETKHLNDFVNIVIEQKLNIFFENVTNHPNIAELIKETKKDLKRLDSASQKFESSKNFCEETINNYEFLKKNYKSFEIFEKKLEKNNLNPFEKASILEFAVYYFENKKTRNIYKIPDEIEKIKISHKSSFDTQNMVLFFKYAQIRKSDSLHKLYYEFQKTMLDCFLQIPNKDRNTLSDVYSLYEGNWEKIRKNMNIHQDFDLLKASIKIEKIEKKYKINVEEMDLIFKKFKNDEIKTQYKDSHDKTTEIYNIKLIV